MPIYTTPLVNPGSLPPLTLDPSLPLPPDETARGGHVRIARRRHVSRCDSPRCLGPHRRRLPPTRARRPSAGPSAARPGHSAALRRLPFFPRADRPRRRAPSTPVAPLRSGKPPPRPQAAPPPEPKLTSPPPRPTSSAAVRRPGRRIRPRRPLPQLRPAKFRRSPSPSGDPRRPHRYSASQI